jgi:hypothetical protein
VLVELGTGYYCNKEIPDAVQLIDRKIQLVNSSIESVENVRVTNVLIFASQGHRSICLLQSIL